MESLNYPGGGFPCIFNVRPDPWGKDPNLTHIFQNHQLVIEQMKKNLVG